MEQHAAAQALEIAAADAEAADSTSADKAEAASTVGDAAGKCSSLSQSSEKDKGFELFKCDLCDFTNTNQRNVSVHMRQKHKDQDQKSSLIDGKQIKNYCEICKTIITYPSLKDHLKEKHRIFKCFWVDPNRPNDSPCEFKASSEAKLNFHGYSEDHF
jgi:hypothetical protein